MTQQRPLVPSDLRSNPASVPRAAFAALLAATRSADPVAVCRSLYTDAIASLLLQRAAVSSGTTSDPEWAAPLVVAATGTWLGSLAPQSAAAALIGSGIRVTFDSAGSINVPVTAAPHTVAPWIAEGAPTPLRAVPLTSVPVAPKKMGIALALTRELARRGQAEAVFNALLREIAAYSLTLHISVNMRRPLKAMPVC